MRKPIVAPLSLALSFGVAVLPVLPELHLAFASHAHYYSPEHHRIEDVIVDGKTPLFSGEVGQPGVAAGASYRVESPACAVANLVVETQVDGATSSVGQGLTGCDVPRYRRPAPVDALILARAPKQSPPLL